MPKRPRTEEESEGPPKRPRPDEREKAPIEEIYYARQLHDLLAFRQDGIQQLLNGIASFKAFLEIVLYHKEEDNRARQISILREWFESERPAEGERDSDRPFLTQLWQAWSFANQQNNEHVSSQIASILALLLKTLSAILDLRDFGLLLCRTLLQEQHLRLVKRCLDAPRHKDFLISPCLRLMIEVTSFDGGALAREVYKRRESTFDMMNLRRNLGMIKLGLSEEEAKRRPSIRTLTVRYVLAHFKYLHEGGKTDILKNRPFCYVLFQHLRDDPADLAAELLTIVEQNIFKDTAVPRSSKAALLTLQNLERVTDIATRVEPQTAVSERAFAWLKSVCTQSSYGILRPAGYYPSRRPRRERGELDSSNRAPETSESSQDNLSDVRNVTLLNWIQTLRPQSNLQERQLVLTCFTSAPELVMAYFSRKPLQLDPKLSNTWIGYASFLFEVVQLPIPDHLGNVDAGEWAELPPSPTAVIESILPSPLTQKILTRCLNQNSTLVAFFATRIMVLALSKLARISQQLRDHASSEFRTVWEEKATDLTHLLIERCPAMKDVIAAFRKVPSDDEHVLHREAITRLLRLYYEVVPLQALEEQFDISTALTAALEREDNSSPSAVSEVRGLRLLELDNFLAIARCNSGMKWFNKQGSLRYSLTTTLLKMWLADADNQEIRRLVEHIFVDSALDAPSESGFTNHTDILLASLLEFQEAHAVWEFLDDCLMRLSKKPVKYLDDLEAVQNKSSSSPEAGEPFGARALLPAVLSEQAPFVVARPDAQRNVQMRWINTYLNVYSDSHSTDPIIEKMKNVIQATKGWPPSRPKQSRPAKELLARLCSAREYAQPSLRVRTSQKDAPPEIPFQPPPREPENHPELARWTQKDIDLAIEDGDIDALILCLCSQHSSIRRQANQQLNKIKYLLQNSPTIDNAIPLALILGELTETFEQQYLPDDLAFPYLGGAFAIHALHVQGTPTHSCYSKLNGFLIRGPEWRISRLPSYWLSNTMLSPPTDDDGYWREVQWVLDWLVDGLRTPVDLEILRRASVFEKTMALASSPGAAVHRAVRKKIFELIYRASVIKGGSEILVARMGVLCWLDGVRKGDADLAAALKERLVPRDVSA